MKSLLFSYETPNYRIKSNWVDLLIMASIIGNNCCAIIASWHAISWIVFGICYFENNCQNNAKTILAYGQKWRSTHFWKDIQTTSSVLHELGPNLSYHKFDLMNQQQLHHFAHMQNTTQGRQFLVPTPSYCVIPDSIRGKCPCSSMYFLISWDISIISVVFLFPNPNIESPASNHSNPTPEWNQC